MNFNFEKYNVPFDHYIVDNFLPDDIAKSISNDFLDYEKKKIDLRAILIVDLKEFMSLKKTSYLFRLEDDFRREMMDKLRANRKNNKIKK